MVRLLHMLPSLRAVPGRAAVLAVVVAAVFCFESGRPGARQSDAFGQAMAAGRLALARHQYQAAADAFARANALLHDRSPEAALGFARAERGLGAYQKAVDLCTGALIWTRGDTAMEAQLRAERGVAVLEGASKLGRARLAEAEADFRAALAAGDAVPAARYYLGVALVQQNRDAEGIAELKAFVAAGGSGPEVEDAKSIILNPRRSRTNYPTEFDITTRDGEHLTLGDLHGKVVLLDFWGSWCGPCRAAIPSIAKIYRKYVGQPFVLIGVAVGEASRAGWANYIDQHAMPWRHYLDSPPILNRRFNVHTVPTYILIDGEGIVRDRQTGWNEGVADAAIRKALKALGGLQ
jgi:thiol-disulfide isomerase/thioredoxin